MVKRNYNALLWDDMPSKPQRGYIENIVKKLQEFDVDVVVTTDPLECHRAFEQAIDKWDLLILDLVNDTKDEEEDPQAKDSEAGLRLAAMLRKQKPRIPIVFLTDNVQFILRGKASPYIEEPLLARHKSNPATVNALDIVMFLRRQKRDWNDSKVFVIYGHGRQCTGLRDNIEHEIKEYGAIVEKVDPSRETAHLSQAILGSMADSGFIVAICSPDDHLASGKWIPRGNVLLEIGIAFGFPESRRRLVILQRWGPDADSKAELPTDLEGILVERFSSDQSDLPSKVLEILKARGLLRAESNKREIAWEGST